MVKHAADRPHATPSQDLEERHAAELASLRQQFEEEAAAFAAAWGAEAAAAAEAARAAEQGLLERQLNELAEAKVGCRAAAP